MSGLSPINYICIRCKERDEKNNRQNRIRYHRYKNEKRYCCKICDIVFSCWSSMDKHMFTKKHLKCVEYMKIHGENWRDILERDTQLLKLNDTFFCCGKTYKINYKSLHMKTERHKRIQEFENSNELNLPYKKWLELRQKKNREKYSNKFEYYHKRFMNDLLNGGPDFS